MSTKPKEITEPTGTVYSGQQTRAATYDKNANTIECIFATPTPVPRWSWRINDGETFNEVLSIKKEAIDSTRLDAGAVPFLDNHNAYGSVGSIQIGKVISWEIVGQECRAKIQLSTAEEHKGTVDNIINGTYSNISVGYRVSEYTDISPKPAKIAVGQTAPKETKTFLATKWEVSEISLVAVPADPQAQIRSEQQNYIQTKFKIMPTEGTPPADNTQPSAEQLAQIRKETASYAHEVMDLQTRYNLEPDFAKRHIEAGTPIGDVRAIVLDKFKATNPAPAPTAAAPEVGADREREGNIRSAVAGVSARIGGVVAKSLSEEEKRLGQDFRNMTLLEIAADCVERTGVKTRGMDKMELAKRAITSTQSDFPIIINDLMNKTLLANYQTTESTWKRFCSTGSTNDFRPNYRVRGGELPILEEITEAGEYKNIKQGDGKMESIRVKTVGGIITLSRQAIINDDLQFFTNQGLRLSRSAALTIEQAVYTLLGLNSGVGPTMADGNALFSAAHGNLIATGSGAAPSFAEVQKMIDLFAFQKDVNGKNYIVVNPTIALAPVAIKNQLNVINQSQYNTDTSGKFQVPNIINGVFRDVIGSPYLTQAKPKAYYAFADPAMYPTIEVAFLNGQESPFFEMEQGFDVDGVRMKGRLDFGVAAVDWVGAVLNQGE